MAKKAIAKPKKNMKGRPRGGASVSCPMCGKNSQVILTRRTESGKVDRLRHCSKGHRFNTTEVVVDA